MAATEKTLCEKDAQEISNLIPRTVTAIYIEKQNKGLYLEFETTDEEESPLYLAICAYNGVSNSYVKLLFHKANKIFPEEDYTSAEESIGELSELIGHDLVGLKPEDDGIVLHFHQGSFHQTLKLTPWLEAFGFKTDGDRTVMKGMRPVLVATKTGKPFPQH
ncbi:MAG: hypothetical protein Q7S53_01760 [bacterium]|nr:hypothetical protein [bacterium]